VSVAVYFETEQYYHLVCVDHEDQIEEGIYRELSDSFSKGDTFDVVAPEGGPMVSASSEPLVDNKILQEKVVGIINKFKEENESV
jgi:hypothetical protein